MQGTSDGPAKIVVGIDLSPEATDALEWAQNFARPNDTIVALHAWTVPIYGVMNSVEWYFPAEFDEIAQEEIAALAARVDDPRLTTLVKRGHPGMEVVAEAADAHLIVVGHRGDSRVSMMLGSTANYVLHHAACPVAIIRGDRRVARPRRVVVGVDAHDMSEPGSTNESVRALQWAYQLPDVEQVRVLHGWFIPPITVGMFATPQVDVDAMDGAARAAIDSVIAAAGEHPDSVTVVAEVARRPGGVALIEASKAADLVVVGSRGRGGFAGLLLGSTSAEVAAHSHSPVVVVR